MNKQHPWLFVIIKRKFNCFSRHWLHNRLTIYVLVLMQKCNNFLLHTHSHAEGFMQRFVGTRKLLLFGIITWPTPPLPASSVRAHPLSAYHHIFSIIFRDLGEGSGQDGCIFSFIRFSATHVYHM